MLKDQDIASDVLEMVKHDTVDLLKACLESSNQELRQSLMQFVNRGVQTQYEIYRLAEKNGWYLPAAKADPGDVQRVEQFYRQQAAVPVRP